MSSSTSNVLLASTQHIDYPTSIAFAVIYGLFFVAIQYKTLRASAHRSILRFFSILCVVRLVTFALRAVLAHMTTMPSTGVELAAAILLLAGYLFFVEGVMSLTTLRFLALRNITLDGSKKLAVHLIQHLVVVSVSAIGIVGAVKLTNVTDQDDFNTAKSLRIASGALFVVMAIALLTFTVVDATVHAATQSPPRSTLVKTSFLILLDICLIVEALYRVWSSSTYSGFITGNVAIAVLVFVPEIVALLAILSVDFTDVLEPRMVWQQEQRYDIERVPVKMIN